MTQDRWRGYKPNPEPDLPTDRGWRLRHSRWMLAVVLGFGLLSWIGFAYCAIRTRDPRWRAPLVAFFGASIAGWIMYATWTRPDGGLTNAAQSYVVCMWLSAIVFGLFAGPDYLRWRASQEPGR